MQAELVQSKCKQFQLSSHYKKKGEGEGKGEKKVTLPCKSLFAVSRYAFSSMPYKHTSVLTLNFTICVLGNRESDLASVVWWLLAVPFWCYGGIQKLRSGI